MPFIFNKKIEPRVSDATLDRMRFLTGSLGDARGVTLRLIIDGAPYTIAFDDNGMGTIIEQPTVVAGIPSGAQG